MIAEEKSSAIVMQQIWFNKVKKKGTQSKEKRLKATELTQRYLPVCRSLANILLIFISKTAKYQRKLRVTLLTS